MSPNSQRFLVACWLALAGAGAARGDSTGAFSGTVLDDSGKPVANAVVQYGKIRAAVMGINGRPVSVGTPFGSAVRTSADGSFAVAGLPPGTYQICAYGPMNFHLGSCEWTHGMVTLDLSNGQATRGLTLQVAVGALVTFEVQDPKGQIRDMADLQQAHGGIPAAGANFRVGIMAGTRYVQATRVSSAGNLREYQVAIPKTATVRIFVDTSLHVTDAGGAAVTAFRPGAAVSVAGQAVVRIPLTVQ